MTRVEIMQWAWWVCDLCLKMGSEVKTAYACAATFAAGLEELHRPENIDRK